MQKLKVVIILGTAREGRRSEKVAQFIENEVKDRDDISVSLIDTRNYLWGKTLPEWEDHEETENWKKIAKEANAFILVVPEYNRGYPGELKILLDAGYSHYSKKPVLIVGVSDGPWGGVRVSEHIRPVLLELGMIPIKGGVFFPLADKAFDQSGEIIDGSYHKKVKSKVDELVEMAGVLLPLQNK